MQLRSPGPDSRHSFEASELIIWKREQEQLLTHLHRCAKICSAESKLRRHLVSLTSRNEAQILHTYPCILSRGHQILAHGPSPSVYRARWLQSASRNMLHEWSYCCLSNLQSTTEAKDSAFGYHDRTIFWGSLTFLLYLYKWQCLHKPVDRAELASRKLALAKNKYSFSDLSP